ncbi:MAG: transporter substrate-binding protein [Paenibacillus sp.]|nr:transporter substrate-binding protein [Paenibacillus sp.]
MKRKLLSLFCTVSLGGSLALSGCSSGGTSPPKETDPPKDTATPGKNETAANKAQKVYIFASSTTSKPEAMDEVRKAIMEKSGVEVVPVIAPKGSEAEKLNILLSSGEPLDIFQGSYADYQAKGAVQPLNKLLDQYGTHIKALWPKEWETSWKALSTADGQIWAIPTVPPTAYYTIYVRTDWLKKLNLTMPRTVDELEHVLKEFKDKDPAGSGQTIPLLTDLPSLNNALSAGFMDMGYSKWIDSDGKVKPSEMNPGYKEFIARVADWYKKGFLYKESFTAKRDRQIELVKQNRVGVAILPHSTVNMNEYALQKNEPEAKYEVAAELKGPKGNVITMGGIGASGFMINRNSKNPEAAIRYIDWLHSDIENYFLAFYGIKGKHWRYVDEKNHIIEKMNEDYLGDYITALTFAYTVRFQVSDPANAPQFDYIRKYVTDESRTKKMADADVSYKYDTKEIVSQLPGKSDFDRMLAEETVKFIMGSRPMSEYDAFLQELNKAGLDKWIGVFTDQYNKAKSGK